VNAEREEVLAERLNSEPAIFRGCSSSELGVMVAVAAAFWLPASLIVTGLAGALPLGFGLAGLGIVGSVVLAASAFRRLKRNRPDGYYQQRLSLTLAALRLHRSPFIDRSGPWDIGRTRHAPLPPGD